MPIDVKDPEKTQEDVDNDFQGIVDSSLADLKGLGGGREQKKAAKDEAKENKKNDVSKKEQKARGIDDPLNQQHQKDKNVGHFSKLAKAAKQGKRGERMDAAKTMAKRYAMKRLRKAAMQKLATVVLANPYVIGAIAIGVFLILLIVIILGGDETLNAELINQENRIPLTISKTGPSSAQAGEELSYQITVAYPGSAEDIIITDQIPENADYVDSTPPAKYDDATRIATWNLKDYSASPGGALSNVNQALSIKLRARENDSYVVNQAAGTVIAPKVTPGKGPITKNYLPPNTNTCEGKYIFKAPIGNFGDPSCNFDKNALYDMLKEQDSANADTWFFRVVPCESQYNPNAHATHEEIGTPDPGGAWGLFQMGSSSPPGQPPPAPGRNGPNDRGDVNWPVQTENATTYGKILSSLEDYWDGAREHNRERCWEK
jgi:hypothetical protein